MLSIENEKSTIHLFGRGEDKKSYHKKINFSPYFYAIDEQGDYNSIAGEKAKKILCKSPDEVPKLRENYEKTFEADVVFVNRYLIDEVEQIPKQPIRKCYLDIETDSVNGFPDPEIADQKILSITCYDNFLKKYVSFMTGDNKNRNDSEWSIYYFKNEIELLKKFLSFVKSTNPDMILGWNSDQFDMPYIINRSDKLNVESSELCRIGQPYYKNKTPKCRGRILFDLLWGYKKISQGSRESYSLDYISNYELNTGKIEYPYVMEEFFYKDPKLFLDYNKRDVELLVMLDEKLNIVEFFDEVRRFAKCTFEDVFNNSRIVDNMILQRAKERGVVLPTKTKRDSKKYEGGFVHKTIPGLQKNVAVLDMKSLYPSIMYSFNIGSENLLEKPDYYSDVINIDNKYFFEKSPSLIRDMIKELLEERAKLKKRMKEQKKDSMEYKSLDLQQYAVKVINNSIYGVMGFAGFRLYNHSVAACVTYMARKIIAFVIQKAEEKGYKTVYGDTDSIFTLMEDKSIEDVKKLCDEINKDLDEFAKSFRVTDHILELEFEKMYKTIFFTKAKKRYAGILCWKDGKDVDELSITGFETRRSDMPEIGKEFQKTLFVNILNKGTKEDVIKLVEDYKQKVKEDYVEDIALPIGVSKDIKSYKNIPIHIRAVRNANKYHNANIKGGDKVKYVYVKSGKCNDNVIAFKNKMWEGYKVDYDKMFERIIQNKVDVVLEALEWNKVKSKSLGEWF